MEELPLHRIDKRLARRSFSRSATTYDQTAVLQRQVGGELVERLELFRIRPKRILDLGCGTGRVTEALLRRYPKAQVIALDIALPMVRHTARRGGWLRRPRAVCADGERLPFRDDGFDLIVSNLMLQWCTDLEQTFQGLFQVLRPGGLFLFATFGPDTLKELRVSWAAADRHPHVHEFPDMHDVGDALVRSRFVNPVLDVDRMTLTYPDVRALMRDLKQIGAHNAAQGRSRGLTGKGRLRTMIQAYEQYRREGLLPASYEVVHGHAWCPEAKSVTSGALTETRISADLLRRR